MDGELFVDSRLGEGSTFSFSLPLQPDPKPVVPPPSAGDLSGLRVLIVDDNHVNRHIVHEQITSWGMRNGSFAEGGEALEAMRAASRACDPYDFVIADYQMPGMDGATLAKEIKADPATRNALVVILSSIGDSREIKALQGSTVDAHMVKPVRQSQLFNALAAAWALKTDPAAAPEASTPAPRASFDGSHLRVLVAEDNVVNQKVALSILARMAIRADVAGNGREAVDMLRMLPYDCVFMDCQMPEMNGYEAAAEIRRNEPPGRRIPIIAMTADVLGDGRERCLAAGMDDFVPKPIQVETLANALRRWAPSRQS